MIYNNKRYVNVLKSVFSCCLVGGVSFVLKGTGLKPDYKVVWGHVPERKFSEMEPECCTLRSF